jgi:hypothetical protein
MAVREQASAARSLRRPTPSARAHDMDDAKVVELVPTPGCSGSEADSAKPSALNDLSAVIRL